MESLEGDPCGPMRGAPYGRGDPDPIDPSPRTPLDPIPPQSLTQFECTRAAHKNHDLLSRTPRTVKRKRLHPADGLMTDRSLQVGTIPCPLSLVGVKEGRAHVSREKTGASGRPGAARRSSTVPVPMASLRRRAPGTPPPPKSIQNQNQDVFGNLILKPIGYKNEIWCIKNPYPQISTTPRDEITAQKKLQMDSQWRSG